MKDIVTDIVDNIEIKGNKSKLILRWIISISIALISSAYFIGAMKTNYVNRLKSIEEKLEKNTQINMEMYVRIENGFRNVNSRIDKVYDDGYTAFYEYQVYNKNQFELIIEYGSQNSDILKKVMAINSIEKTKNVEIELEKAKKESIISSMKPISNDGYINKVGILNGVGDTTYYAVGATSNFIKNIDTNKYIILKINDNFEFFGLYNVEYKNRK